MKRKEEEEERRAKEEILILQHFRAALVGSIIPALPAQATVEGRGIDWRV
jgi:hypothetical protein